MKVGSNLQPPCDNAQCACSRAAEFDGPADQCVKSECPAGDLESEFDLTKHPPPPTYTHKVMLIVKPLIMVMQKCTVPHARNAAQVIAVSAAPTKWQRRDGVENTWAHGLDLCAVWKRRYLSSLQR